MDAVVIELSSDEEDERIASKVHATSYLDELVAENMQSSSAMDSRNNDTPEPATASLSVHTVSFDIDSVKGKFGWDLLLKGKLPYITRWVDGGERVKYFSVYHAEKFLLANYLAFISGTVISTCMTVHGHHITNAEATLLTELNKKHCNPKENYKFKAGQDYIVSAKDMYKFYTFLITCHGKLKYPSLYQASFGFVCFNKMVVPYVIRNGTKYLPISFFEEFQCIYCIQSLQRLMGRIIQLSGLQLAHMKFCCMVQDIGTDDISQLQLSTVISLKELKRYIPENVNQYWPAKKKISSQVFNTSGCIGKWITEPSSPSITLFKCVNTTNTIAANQNKVMDDNGKPTTMLVNSDTTSLAGCSKNTKRRQPMPSTECSIIDGTVKFTSMSRKLTRSNTKTTIVNIDNDDDDLPTTSAVTI